MSIGVLALSWLLGCDRQEALEQGADLLQSMPPIRKIDVVLSGFHFASGEPERQEEAMHYCHVWSEQLTQCVLYDGDDADAFQVGVEHVVSRAVFDALPDEEKVLWHPHTYEVRSGLLVAPGLPLAVEEELMRTLVTTYGKTWHVWHAADDPYPTGVPALMKGFTEDGQIDPALVAARDERLGVDTEERRRERADIPDPGFDPIVLEEPQVELAPEPLPEDEVSVGADGG